MAAHRPSGVDRSLMRVLVTGATGFLGARVLRRLRLDGHDVVAHGLEPHPPTWLDQAITYRNGDLADPGDAGRVLADASCDVIVHPAGPVTGGTEDLATGIEVVTSHARSALHVMRWAKHARVVLASSMTVYGLPRAIPIYEDARRAPQHLYGLAKLVAEDIVLADSSRDAWVLRLPGLFSEDRTNGALYHWSLAASRGEPIRVAAMTPTAWNVLHVDDAALAIGRAVTARRTIPTPCAINVAYDAPIELVAVARLVAELGAKGSPVIFPEHIVHPVSRLAIERARALLGWQPPILRERLATLVAAYARGATQ